MAISRRDFIKFVPPTAAMLTAAAMGIVEPRWNFNADADLTRRVSDNIKERGLEDYAERLKMVPSAIKRSLVLMEPGSVNPGAIGNGTILNIFHGKNDRNYLSVLTAAHVFENTPEDKYPDYRISKLLGNLARLSCYGRVGYSNKDMGGDNRDLGVLIVDIGSDEQSGNIQDQYFGQYAREIGRYKYLEEMRQEELRTLYLKSVGSSTIEDDPQIKSELESNGINYEDIRNNPPILPILSDCPSIKKTMSHSLYMSEKMVVKRGMSGSPVYDNDGIIAGVLVKVDKDLKDLTTMHPSLDGGIFCAIPSDFQRNYSRLLYSYMFG